MIFKEFLLILLLVSIFSNSVESTKFNCDSLFLEAEDTYLGQFLFRHDLMGDYERRNQNFEACFHFLGRFFLLIDQYRNEEGKQDSLKVNKRTSKMKPKGALKFNF